MKTTALFISIFVVFLAIVASTGPLKKHFSVRQDTQNTTIVSGKDKQEIAAQVEAFGMRLKNVSLLSPTVVADIEREYVAYLSTSLLTVWMSHPDRAAGRETSSPWPERIDVIEIERNENGTYGVRAMLVYMTSTEAAGGGNAGTANLSMIVVKEDGAWKIDSYEMTRTNAPNAPLGDSDRPKLE